MALTPGTFALHRPSLRLVEVLDSPAALPHGFVLVLDLTTYQENVLDVAQLVVR